MNLTTPLRRAAAVLGSIALAASGALVAGQQAAHAAESTIISTADTQRNYLDDGTNPASGDNPDAWAAPSFDDASWKTAAGSFGAKRGVIGNVDGYTPATLLKAITAPTDRSIPPVRITNVMPTARITRWALLMSRVEIVLGCRIAP